MSPFSLTSISVFFLPLVCSLAIGKDHHHLVGMKHNKSFFYPKYRHDVFYDSKVIPEDTEVDVFLHRNQIQKLFFLLESGYRPISVTVTPCSSDSFLEWKISHSMFQNSISGSSYSGAWSNHVIRPPLPAPAATYMGKDRRSYTNPRAPPGLYTLELRSGTESRARILATTRPISQMPYHPPLPPEPGVKIIKIKRNRILVSWKASLSSRPLEYCVTSNNRGNYNSLCSAEDDLYGTIPFHPPLSTSYHRFFASVNSQHGHPKHGANITCIGRKTWHMFKGLQRGKTYYLDVFVLDTETNASSAYVGVSVTMRSMPSLPSRLKDDSLVTFTLDESNGYGMNTKYHLGRSASPVLLFIQSCTGPGPVILHITQNGVSKQEVLSTNVMDVKTLEVHQITASMNGTGNNSSSQFILSIQSTTRHPRKVRVWISGKKHAFPFPVLPQDKSVIVFDTLTTCNSITIGWKTSPDERVKYCIYRHTVFDEQQQRMLDHPQNFCEPSTNGSTTRHTVLCRRYHRFSKRRFNNVIMQRIRGLLPGTMYLFEVQVTKVKGKMLPYEQVWATTHDACSHSKKHR